MPKEKIKELVIVEGKTDVAKLKSLFDVDVIATNGLSLNKKTINDIKTLSKDKGVILFLDPDFPGEKIRKKLLELFPNSKNCFIDKKNINSKSKKIGVAEAYNQAIVEAIKNSVTFINKNKSITWLEFISLNIDSVVLRKKVCDVLKISYCNNKQFYKRLNMLNISYDKLKKILSEISHKI